jgi:hypothetical protein
MDYTIKSNAAAIAALITPAAGSAKILHSALSAIAAEPDFHPAPTAVGIVMEDRIVEILRGCIPDESTSEQWREYRLDSDTYRRRIFFHNMFCGCEIFVKYFVGNTQYIVSAGFQTMYGKGREYVITDSGVDTYRVRNTAEKI